MSRNLSHVAALAVTLAIKFYCCIEVCLISHITYNLVHCIRFLKALNVGAFHRNVGSVYDQLLVLSKRTFDLLIYAFFQQDNQEQLVVLDTWVIQVRVRD